MYEWLDNRFGSTGALLIAPVVYALLIMLVFMFGELPTDTFRYLDM